MISTSPEITQLRPVRSVHLGSRLKLARKAAGLTQQDIADRLGVDESEPSRWECVTATRYRPVPAARLERLCSILGTSVQELAPESLAAGDPIDDDDAFTDDTEAGKPLGMLTAADLFTGATEQEQPLPVGTVSSTHLLTYTSAPIPLADDGCAPAPMAGRPRQVEDALAHFALRCPWCRARYTMVERLQASYGQDPLPIASGGDCPSCGKQLRATVTLRVRVQNNEATLARR